MAKVKDLNKPLGVGEIVTYSLGSLGREFSNNCVNAFFLVYLCVYMNLKPLPMTIAFVLAKLWDAVNDPMLATLVNNSKKSRFGRYRPWILLGAVLNTITMVLMFTPIGEGVAIGWKYTYYIGMYIIWGMSFTVMDVPFWSMLPTIANSTEERNKASSMAKLIGGLGGFLVGMVGTSLILPNFESQIKGYQILGLVAGLIMIVFVLFTVVFNREKYEVPHEKVSLGAIFDMFKKNDQLRAYAACYVLFTIGTTIALFQLLYLYVYCYENAANLLSSEYSYTLFWIIACTGQGIAMFFYNQLTKRIPREKIFGITFLACVVSYVLMFLVFFPLKPGQYLVNTILVALSGAFLMIASGMNQIGSTVMIADVVDYGEWKTGKRGDSVIFSVQTLLLKFAGAIAMLILGIGITVAQLPNVREVFDESAGKLVQQFVDNAGNIVDGSIVNGQKLNILRVFMFLVPIPFAIAGYFVYKKKYWLFGDKYDVIKKEIDERRLAADGAVLEVNAEAAPAEGDVPALDIAAAAEVVSADTEE